MQARNIPNSLVAAGNNRVNSGGNNAVVSPLAQTSIVYPLVIPANTTAPIPCSGTMFYVAVATAEVKLRPIGGVFNVYLPGTGLKLPTINAFPSLEARNDNAFPIVVQVFVGFDNLIDNRLILNQTGQKLVAFPTYPTASAGAAVAINDLSGSEFTDINGNDWFAISREAIYIFNLDAGVTLLLQESGSSVANGPAAGVIFPTTGLRYAASGNFSLSVGGGNINAIVSELYDAIPAVSV